MNRSQHDQIKEYLDLNDNYSYHKVSTKDWRGIGYREIPKNAHLCYLNCFYQRISDEEWLIWNTAQECWNPSNCIFTNDSRDIHWIREGVELRSQK